MIPPMPDMKKPTLALIAFLSIATCTIIVSSTSAFANNARTAKQLYSKYCVACHGADGRSQTSKGKYSHARDLTDGQWQDEVSDERLFNSIMNGRNVRGNMPGFSDKLKAKDAESLVTLVRGFRR
jgi:mono/diheme cytochrome c family protein